MSHEFHESPLNTRYASEAMRRLWSDQRKFSTWRRLWVALAEAEHELGLPVTAEQVAELRQHVDDVDFAVAAEYERKLRHDVMAHVHAYGDCCPTARAIIHLGATSCYVTDNTDLILLREGWQMIRDRLWQVIAALADFAARQAELPCLAYTHLQPAQPTTVGKRACLWAYDLVLDLEELEHRLARLKARSIKGTTGTQASFLKLFDGNHAAVRELERRISAKLGFADSYAVTGQTYSRKIDAQCLDVLSGVAQSAHKAATDLRLLAHRREIVEPFETQQIGSSAMAYKRNPMRCERICALSRFVMTLSANGSQTMATQWMERTLDDSANRRLVLPQAFLATDAVLLLYHNVVSGLVVYPGVIARNLATELPFLATEDILMAAVAAGGDRQELHERIRQHSLAAAEAVNVHGTPNDLFDRLERDDAFRGTIPRESRDPLHYTGRAARQVAEFLEEVIAPLRARMPQTRSIAAEVRV